MKESQLENKTAIATNDYVRMVDENNNSVKIKKDSFMAAIRDALPSIISDGATDGGSVLSIIGGALKSRTDANLASVLGALQDCGLSYADANTIRKQGLYYSSNSMSNMPTISGTDYYAGWGVLIHLNCTDTMMQFYHGGANSPGTAFFVRSGANSTGEWKDWKEIKRWF